MEHVNHPQHYNSHPNGIECIDIIRHYVCDIANAIKYLWRAGLKVELGMEDAEKEIEDLRAYDGDPDPGISWTLDEQWCQGYAKAKGRRVKQMQVSRDQVFAYVSRRGEEEVIVL